MEPTACHTSGRRKGQHVLKTALVEAGQRRQLAKAELSAVLIKDAIRRNLVDAAYGDKRRFFTKRGKLRRVVDLTADEVDLLAGFEVIVKNAEAGDGHLDTIHKIKFRTDQVHWAELGARHLGMLNDRLNVGLSDTELLEALAEGRKRVQANTEEEKKG